MEITILDESDNWYKIRPSIGVDGWVPNYAVNIEKVERTAPAQELLGFYLGGELGYNSLLENGAKLTGIASRGWKLDSYGGLTVTSDFDHEEVGRSLYFAGNQEMDTYANISINANPTRLLSTAALSEKSINQILDMLREWGLKGVLIDVTYIPGEEQGQLFAFLGKLAERLRPQGLKINVALPWATTIDYEAASQSVDYIILKYASDPSGAKPGPAEPLPQVEAMLEEITSFMSADKVILSISTGGINWSRLGVPVSLTHQEILEMAAREGASVRWDADSKTPYFQYGAGQEVWFENRYSLKYKIDLVKKYNLGGLALKDLGQEDADVWTHL
jgi:spore germination protein YaaH